jgi:hypothetical protein
MSLTDQMLSAGNFSPQHLTEVSGWTHGPGALPPGIGTGDSGVWEKKILLLLPGFETRIDQNVAYTLHRLIHLSRLPSSERAAKTASRFPCISTWHVLERHQKHQYWVQKLRKVLCGSKIRQAITIFMYRSNLYLPCRRSLLCESHNVSIVTTERCFWVTSHLF